MRIALEVWSSDFGRLDVTCRHAEGLGLDAFYYGESPNDLNLDCWTTLAALARTTERIRLGPVIANVLPTYRSTVLLARQAATVAAISGDRVDLRTGVGAAAPFGRAWWEPYGVAYPGYEQRLSDLRAALVALPGLWAGSTSRPGQGRPAIPVTVAARGERAMRLAAAHADVWETSFCTPDEFREQADRLQPLLQGRGVTRSLEIDGFLSRSDRDLARLLDRVRADRGAAEDLQPVFQRALLGTPPQAADRLAELAAAGVQQVVVALHDPHDTDALEALARAAGRC